MNTARNFFRNFADKVLIGSIGGAMALATLGGCRGFKLDPPDGFVEVESGSNGAHFKASDDAGLRVAVFENKKGGTLAYWSRDLVKKLGTRGYVLTRQSAATSDNGVVGARFDFEYIAPGSEGPKRFYSAVVFPTDDDLFVVQLAGAHAYYERYAAQVDAIASSVKTRGCRVRSKICKGTQPESLDALAAGPKR